MRLIVSVTALFLFLCSTAGAAGFTAEESVRWLAANPQAVIVDVANIPSYQFEHLANAINIPVENISREETEALYKSLPEGRPVLIYDRTGILSPRVYHELREARPDLTEINYIFDRPPFDSLETTGR